ncbi:MFS transporter [Priestia koreensis]|uniref:MFS transporter n=1 Tax=Priestia koreensis TaxID=284581 RepID=UPI003459F169
MQVVTKANAAPKQMVYQILFAISAGHLLNDSMQAVVPAVFPILEKSMNLSYAQIGWIAFVLNMTSSLLQPVFGYYADRKSSPFLLPLGMFFSLIGMIGLALAPHFYVVLASVLFIGLGSAIFHPEGSRVAYMASGPKRGLAQSIYQVGGNTGNSLAPVFTALVFLPLGQRGALWFTGLSALGMMVLWYVSIWYRGQLAQGVATKKRPQSAVPAGNISRSVKVAIGLLIFLVFARSWYGAGISSFYQFYLREHYDITIKHAQTYIFIFMMAGVLGTFFGGPLADRFGKRNVILFSMIGSVPLTLLLPHVSLAMVIPLLFLIGFILSSSFSVTVVYAQELLPGRIGMVSGLIVGLAFGMGALGSVVLGNLADLFNLRFIMIFCSVLPVLGVLTWLLPSDEKIKQMYAS